MLPVNIDIKLWGYQQGVRSRYYSLQVTGPRDQIRIHGMQLEYPILCQQAGGLRADLLTGLTERKTV